MSNLKRKIVLIVGMHRSGTSALTGSMVQLGYPMPKTPMPGNSSNPKGHFESIEIRAANERVFDQMGRTWHHCGPVNLDKLTDRAGAVEELANTVISEFGDNPKIAVKDPRISLLLPLWDEVCAKLNLQASYVLMRRHPFEVAASLNRRNGMSVNVGHCLWARYMLEAEHHTRGRHRLGVDAADLIANPEVTIEKLADFLDDTAALTALRSGALQEFVDPKLLTSVACPNHERRTQDGIYEALVEVAEAEAQGTVATAAQSRLDQAREMLIYPSQVIDELDHVNDQLDVMGRTLAQERLNQAKLQKESEKANIKVAQLEAEDQRLREELVKARAKPIRNLKDYFTYNFLASITKPTSKLPTKMRERFKRSAKKRWPKRDAKRPDFSLPSYGAVAFKATMKPKKFDLAAAQLWKNTLLASDVTARLRKENPLVSIVTPTKDRASILPMAIDSVLAQTYQNWELIIVDDGSTDDTVELIETRYTDRRIRVVPAEGSGVSAARNTGLAQATGTVIAYLDSDNRWMTDYLQISLLEMLRSGAKSCYSVLRGFRNGLDASDGIYYYNKAFDLDALKFENYIDLNVFVHDRSLFDQLGGFDETLRRMVDWDLILRYCRDQPPAFCESVGVDYDNSSRGDRISKKENRSYLNVVRNKHMIDWERLAVTLPARDPDLVSVVICVYNNPELTDACLRSLETHQAGVPFEIIVVDNGSTPETRTMLEAWAAKTPHLTLIVNPENMDFAFGNTLGFAASSGARVVFLNNDTEVTPEWLRSLVTPLQDPTILGVQPMLLYPDGTVQGIGLTFSEHSPFAYGLYTGLPGDHPLTRTRRRFHAITAACLAMRAEDYIEMRGFDPIYTNGQEDVDLCLRLAAAKKNDPDAKPEPAFTCATDAVVFHHEGKTQGRTAGIKGNRMVFAERWRGKTVADDQDHYSKDGVQAENYAADAQELEQIDLAVYCPTLTIPAHLAAPERIKSVYENTIRLRVPCPRVELKDRWGDYHFAAALAGAFARQGVQARIDFLNQWNDPAGAGEIDLVLRGLSTFPDTNPKRGKRKTQGSRLMWMISHPDKVEDEELATYDTVFVASHGWAERLSRKQLGPQIVPLLQCTEAERFFPETRSSARHYDRLFVGNSRKVLRTMVAKAIEEELPLDIFGEMWDGLAPETWVHGENIPNSELPSYYASAGVVLCDHWDTMRGSGFVSNRIFDVLATGAPLVSDRVADIPDDLAKAYTVMEDGDSLKEAIDQSQTRHSLAERLEIAQWVRSRHSFNARARTILQHL